MAPVLPKSFVDVSTALTRRGGEVNVIGRVTDFQVPKPSRGTDWMSTFTLTDAIPAGNYEEGLRIKYFKPSEHEHPQIRSHGDIVLVRNLPVKEFNGAVGGLSTKTTSWTVFPVSSVPERAPPNRLNIKNLRLPTTEEPKYSEMLYAIELCNSRDKTLDKSSGIPISSMDPSTLSASSIERPTQGSVSSAKTGGRASTGGRDKFSLIKDLEIDKFYDIVGQVVKSYANNSRLEMYVTDYTTNTSLYLYEWGKEADNGYSSSMSKSKKWPGPWGKMTLMTTLWPPHSDFADGLIKPGQFVFMQNVHIKMDRDNRMEGAMHEDRYYRSKVLIRVLNDDDERVRNVLRRKKEYNEKFKAQSEASVKDVRDLKDNGNQAKKPNQKTARKKRRREREKQAELEKGQPLSKKQKKQDHTQTEDEESSESSSPSAAQPPRPKSTTKLNRSNLNKNVHCSHHTIATMPLSTILSLDPSHNVTTPSGITHTLPFQNNKYRATVRVVDFFPADIANFAVPSRKPSEFDALSDYEASDSDSDSENDLPPDSDDEASGKRKGKRRGGNVGREDIEEDEEAQEKKWEWRFALVLEDADEPKPAKGEQRSRVTVYVAQQDGDFLLKEDAVDLHTSPPSLDILREKLFLLWGDLEERKTAAAASSQLHEDSDHSTTIKDNDDGPKSKPFQCCLQEYGIRARKAKHGVDGEEEDGEDAEEEGGGDEGTGWERRWRMFGTTII